MADRGWKQFERRLARDRGVQRIPVTGERHGADFADAVACYQAKNRRELPAWLWLWLDGIRGAAQRAGRCGVLVLKLPRMRDDDAVVVMTWRDYNRLVPVQRRDWPPPEPEGRSPFDA